MRVQKEALVGVSGDMLACSQKKSRAENYCMHYLTTPPVFQKCPTVKICGDRNGETDSKLFRSKTIAE